MRTTKQLQVFYQDRLVGRLAEATQKKIAFEYDDTWLTDGFSISPFSLPLQKQVLLPTKTYFQGLFGVFADSLPDAWGNVLLNRILRQNGIHPDSLSVLDRLAIVGDSGMGALTYHPEILLDTKISDIDLDELAAQCQAILTTEYSDNLDTLYRLGGTSGGARPKIMTPIDGEDWIIKFPAHVDHPNAGEMEYAYAQCAARCGIPMTETRLFPSGLCTGYFGTKRFDRTLPQTGAEGPDTEGQDTERQGIGVPERIHMLTAAALLELDFTQPSLDYHSLMKLTKILTHDNPEDVESMYRRMCFNVYAHNRDDHAKNFTYLYDETAGQWRLSPAYDLTYSTTYYGEHTTSVDGNGRNPGEKELVTVGTAAGISPATCQKIAREIREIVEDVLKKYLIP